jgi:protein TonB
MRQAGSYILSATIHAAGLALLAFAPGYSRPESAVTSGGVEAGTFFDAVAASASSSDPPPVEFEIAEPLTTDDLPTPEFVPEQTQVAQQRNETVAVAEATLPVLEVRNRVRQSPRVDRPAPSPIANAELIAAALAEQAATPASPLPVKQDTAAKPEKQDTAPTPKPRPQPQPVPAPSVTEKKPSKPAPPEPAKQPVARPVEKPAAKPATNPKPASKAPAQEPRQDEDSKPREASRKGGVGQASGADAVPRPLAGNGQPEYPPDAFDRRQEGTVVLHILVSDKGIAERVTVAKSSGVKSLDDSALKAVRDWKFQPAMRNGKPTALLVRKTINFRIDDSGN